MQTEKRGGAARTAEATPISIRQHLVGLQKAGPDRESPAVRQLDMCHLQRGAIPAQRGKIRALIELKRRARAQDQRHHGRVPDRLTLPLPVCPPVTRKRRDPDQIAPPSP